MATSGSSEQFNKRCDINKMSTYRLSISSSQGCFTAHETEGHCFRIEAALEAWRAEFPHWLSQSLVRRWSLSTSASLSSSPVCLSCSQPPLLWDIICIHGARLLGMKSQTCNYKPRSSAQHSTHKKSRHCQFLAVMPQRKSTSPR